MNWDIWQQGALRLSSFPTLPISISKVFPSADSSFENLIGSQQKCNNYSAKIGCQKTSEVCRTIFHVHLMTFRLLYFLPCPLIPNRLNPFLNQQLISNLPFMVERVSLNQVVSIKVLASRNRRISCFRHQVMVRGVFTGRSHSPTYKVMLHWLMHCTKVEMILTKSRQNLSKRQIRSNLKKQTKQ